MAWLADHALILVVALGLDGLIGDPDLLWRRIGHPVVWAGWLIDRLDRHLNREQKSPRIRLLGGAVSVFVLLALAVLAGMGLEWLLPEGIAGFLLSAVIASVFLAQRGLFEHVSAVYRAFRGPGLVAARRAVARIAGRDPQQLDEAGISRAAIESLAENFSDGVIAPAFWFLLGGLPGIMAYKALNTADSMIGYRSERHEAFGKVAAKLDDVANFIPARLAGLMIVLAAPFRRAALGAMMKDASGHRSPNAGWPEAAMAGALGVALAGPRVYDGQRVEDRWMNAGGRRQVRALDIRVALGVFLRAAGLHGALILALAILLRL
ncbi:MAG TPA: cobalamin biosynthesis protein [Rhizobiales bacterium]|nr:cobalamin biosynthesis protein [Hyphomicrobiales bacterium]